MSKKHTYFVEGNITPEFIATDIAKHASKTDIGAHALFLGQVRKDTINEKEVRAIEYSAYEEMASKELDTIREEILGKYNLRCLHVYHSRGTVKIGEISLFVFVSSKHRKDAVKAMEEIVEHIKHRVPIWKKEIFADSSYKWVE